MAKGGFVGVDNIARKMKSVHVGVDGVARLAVKGYVGVDGVARLWWEIDGEKVVQIAAGGNHSLFLTSAGRVYSCGINTYGQLGRNVASVGAAAANLGLIDGLSGITKIAAGYDHSLFLASSGEVYGSGSNAAGQLGYVKPNGSPSATNLGLIPGLSGIVDIAAGNSHSLFVASSGEVHGCGNNASGQLGYVVATGSATAPNLGLIPGLAGITKAFAGFGHSLFLTSAGQAYGCGRNAYGQLGRAVTSGGAAAANLGLIDGLSGIVDAAAGYDHSLFLASSGLVYACGSNAFGQLGYVKASGSATTPNLGLINGLSGIIKVSSSHYHSLFAASSGQVYSSGQNEQGQLGRAVANGSAATANLGVIDGLSGIEDIAAGNSHSLFVASSGEVHGCGGNASGQLGYVVATGSATTINLGMIEIPLAA